MTYTFYEDPGHGWLAVSLHELSELKLIDKITSYSYVSHDRQTVYLEEDLDLSYFLGAKFGPDRKEAVRKFFDDDVETIYHSDNRIRGLPAYRLATAA